MVSVGPVLRGRRRASRSSRTLGDEERDDLGQKKLSQSVRKRGSRSRAHHLRVWQIRNYPMANHRRAIMYMEGVVSFRSQHILF